MASVMAAVALTIDETYLISHTHMISRAKFVLRDDMLLMVAKGDFNASTEESIMEEIRLAFVRWLTSPATRRRVDDFLVSYQLVTSINVKIHAEGMLMAEAYVRQQVHPVSA